MHYNLDFINHGTVAVIHCVVNPPGVSITYQLSVSWLEKGGGVPSAARRTQPSDLYRGLLVRWSKCSTPRQNTGSRCFHVC